MRKFFQGLTCLFFTISFCSAQYAEILPLRERANLEDKILKQRFETVLPNLMERTSIDTWVFC